MHTAAGHDGVWQRLKSREEIVRHEGAEGGTAAIGKCSSGGEAEREAKANADAASVADSNDSAMARKLNEVSSLLVEIESTADSKAVEALQLAIHALQIAVPAVRRHTSAPTGSRSLSPTDLGRVNSPKATFTKQRNRAASSFWQELNPFHPTHETEVTA